jgi:hypothetical protein
MQKIGNQRGEGTVVVMLSVAILAWSLLWLISDFFPAKAEDLQQVVVLAGVNAEAKAEITSTLNSTPNPSNMELRQLSKRVNEIIVTEIAKKTTGDYMLKTPSAKESEREKQAAIRLTAIESKSWTDLNLMEFAEVVADWWMSKGLVLFLVLGMGLFPVWFTLRSR